LLEFRNPRKERRTRSMRCGGCSSGGIVKENIPMCVFYF
jgi:hypothetical protein